MRLSSVKIGGNYRMGDYFRLDSPLRVGTIVKVLPVEPIAEGSIVFGGRGVRVVRVDDLDAGTEALRRGEELTEETPTYGVPAVALERLPVCAREGCAEPVLGRGRFCSDACRKRAWRARHADPTVRRHRCVRCGDRFEARRGSLYCSTRCRVAAHRARERG